MRAEGLSGSVGRGLCQIPAMMKHRHVAQPSLQDHSNRPRHLRIRSTHYQSLAGAVVRWPPLCQRSRATYAVITSFIEAKWKRVVYAARKRLSYDCAMRRGGRLGHQNQLPFLVCRGASRISADFYGRTGPFGLISAGISHVRPHLQRNIAPWFFHTHCV
jgi:hypothetical protein